MGQNCTCERKGLPLHSVGELESPTATRLQAPGDPLDFGPGVRGWIRAGTSFLAVLTLLLIGLQFVFTLRATDLNDPDIWWHMRNARFVIEQHQFPRQDIYSFTVAGHPWINSEWLAEIPFYLAHRFFGLVGIKALSFFLVDAIILLLLYLCYQESRNFKASVTVCCYITFLATVSYGPRTILFGYIYLLILLAILQRFRTRGTAPMWAVPLLFWFWANTHGSWSIGLIVFFLIGISGLTEASWGHVDAVRWSPKQLRQLIATGLASVVALFLNPFGWRLVYYPFDLAFRQRLNIASVAEWVSVNFHDVRGKLVLIVLVGLLLGALFRNLRWNLGEILVLLFAIYSGLTYIRFLVLLGIVAAPVLARTLDFFPPYRPELDTPRLNAVVILLLVVAMVYYWPREDTIKKSVAETYPSGFLPYLKTHSPRGNVLNFYLWGGYLGWNDPNLKVFIDSRVDIFEYAGVLQDYLNLLGTDNLTHRPDPILDRYRIQYVLFPAVESKNPLHFAGQLVPVLEHDPHWRKIYQDEICVLLQRQ